MVDLTNIILTYSSLYQQSRSHGFLLLARKKKPLETRSKLQAPKISAELHFLFIQFRSFFFGGYQSKDLTETACISKCFIYVRMTKYLKFCIFYH